MLKAFFLSSAAIILGGTGLLKLASVLFSGATYLKHQNPMFSPLTEANVMAIAGILELVVAIALVRIRSHETRAKIILWLSGFFLAYRAATFLLGIGGVCRCLGSAGDWIGLRPETLDAWMLAVIAYMFIGSLCVLLVRPVVKVGVVGHRAAIVALLGIGLLRPSARAEEYQGEGDITFSAFYPTRVQKSSARFQFRVEDRRWWIKTVPTTAEAYDYKEASFDGGTVYSIESVESWVTRARANGEKAGVNIATAFVQRDGEILHDVLCDEIPAIWLTFCSAAFFEQHTNGAMVEPAITFGESPMVPYHRWPFKQRAFWDLQSQLPTLPIEVRYVKDGWVRRPPPHQPIRRSAPFQDGFTNVVLKSERFKRIGMVAFPEIATIETFGPGRWGDTQSQLERYTQYELKLLSASKGSSPGQPFMPKIPGATLVTDKRFWAEAGDVTYFITNAWRSEESITNHARYARQAAETQGARAEYARTLAKKASPKSVRLTGIVLLVVFIGFPIAFAMAKSNNIKTKGKAS